MPGPLNMPVSQSTMRQQVHSQAAARWGGGVGDTHTEWERSTASFEEAIDRWSSGGMLTQSTNCAVVLMGTGTWNDSSSARAGQQQLGPNP
jgi:hypothetical protein